MDEVLVTVGWDIGERRMRYCWDKDEILLIDEWKVDELLVTERWDIGDKRMIDDKCMKYCDRRMRYCWDKDGILVTFKWNIGDKWMIY